MRLRGRELPHTEQEIAGTNLNFRVGVSAGEGELLMNRTAQLIHE